MPLLWRLRRLEPARRFGLPALSAALVAIGLVWAGSRLPELGGDGGLAQARIAQPEPGSHGGAAAADAQSSPRSTYPALERDAVDPRVQQLCSTLHELPRARRAACAGRPTGLTFTSECTRMLNAAVATRALALDGEAAQRCVAETRERYADCSFTAARSLPALPACTQIWRGARADAESCRSSLECAHGRHCRGAGPLDAGVCAPPAPVGAICGTAVDPLALYLPSAERDHPECDGQCLNGRCRTRPPARVAAR
jgi:hypothetical protein